MRHRLGVHLKQVILFGSRARGDFEAESDYDCLAIVDEVSPVIDTIIDEIASELLYHHNAVFSIFPVSVEKYQADRFEPLLINARKEGVVL